MVNWINIYSIQVGNNILLKGLSVHVKFLGFQSIWNELSLNFQLIWTQLINCQGFSFAVWWCFLQWSSVRAFDLMIWDKEIIKDIYPRSWWMRKCVRSLRLLLNTEFMSEFYLLLTWLMVWILHLQPLNTFSDIIFFNMCI